MKSACRRLFSFNLQQAKFDNKKKNRKEEIENWSRRKYSYQNVKTVLFIVDSSSYYS